MLFADTRIELVRPAEMGSSAGRQDLDLIAAAGELPRRLGHHRLRAADDSPSITRGDERDSLASALSPAAMCRRLLSWCLSDLTTERMRLGAAFITRRSWQDGVAVGRQLTTSSVLTGEGFPMSRRVSSRFAAAVVACAFGGHHHSVPPPLAVRIALAQRAVPVPVAPGVSWPGAAWSDCFGGADRAELAVGRDLWRRRRFSPSETRTATFTSSTPPMVPSCQDGPSGSLHHREPSVAIEGSPTIAFLNGPNKPPMIIVGSASIWVEQRHPRGRRFHDQRSREIHLPRRHRAGNRGRSHLDARGRQSDRRTPARHRLRLVRPLHLRAVAGRQASAGLPDQ